MQAMAVPMLAGASAGVVSRIICHPIDTIKSKLQVEVAADRASLSSVLSRTLRSEGVPGLYRGIGSGSVYHRYERMYCHVMSACRAFNRPLLTYSSAVSADITMVGSCLKASH